ncbi:monocarboxylate transporter, putative, partial [Ixodes scapularis]
RYPQRGNTVNPSQHDDQSKTVTDGIEGSEDTPHSIPSITSVFCKPMFFIIVLLGVIIHYTHNVFLSTIVDFAMDRGMSLDTASSLIVYSSLTDFVGSLGLPLFADKKVLRRSTLVMWSYALLGTCLLFFSVVRTVPLFVL